MSLARKTQAKYGAKIPTAPATKAAPQSKTEAAAPAPAKATREAKSNGDKKR